MGFRISGSITIRTRCRQSRNGKLKSRKSRRRYRRIRGRGTRCGCGVRTARAHLGLIARGQERLEATRREVEELGGKALVLPADVADAQQVEAAAERVEQELGPIDIWVNDAMTTIFAPFLEITPAEFKRATEVTYLGQVYGTMAALKRMHPRNRGSYRPGGLGTGVTVPSRCNPLTAGPNMPLLDSRTRSVPS